ncbi:MAG: hypothetical protein ACR2KP_05060 [Egibacteraceae bacterium]
MTTAASTPIRPRPTTSPANGSSRSTEPSSPAGRPRWLTTTADCARLLGTGDVDQVRHHLRLAAGLSPRWWGGPVLVAAERLGPRQYRTALWAALTLERLPPAAAVRRPVEWALDHARSAVRRRR